jgi:hypothetical protein
MAAVKPTSIADLWDAQDDRSAVFTFDITEEDPENPKKRAIVETITIRGKSDYDEEYEDYLNEEINALNREFDALKEKYGEDYEDYVDLQLYRSTRVRLLALTVPEDRKLWDSVEDHRGAKMGVRLMSTMTERFEQAFQEKQTDRPTGGGKRS